MKKVFNSKIIIVLSIIGIMLTGMIIPTSIAENNNDIKGFDKGVSWNSVVPIKKATFVEFDDESFIDDYSYLAAIPTAVFYEDDKLFSHPLLYYQEPLNIGDDYKEITLDARTGINYFMEDWIDYCDNKLDKITSINVAKSKLDQWRSRNYTEIQGENPYDIANQVALNDWVFSDNAVIAVIDEKFEDPDNVIKNKIIKTLPSGKIHEERPFNLEQTNKLNPVHENFMVDEEYKFLKAEVWWDCLIVGPGIVLPAGDPDVQLYVEQDDGWMQATAASYWNVFWPPGKEFAYSHIYKPGNWRVSVTDIPTKSNIPEKNILGIFTLQGQILNVFRRTVTYHVDLTMYPGIDLILPDNPMFGCKSADFKLTWNNPNVNLGFTLIGPGGDAIHTAINESRTEEIEMHINQLGECLPGENYSISVFSTRDIESPVDFEIEYTFEQKIPEEKSESLTSATEGAILASILNAPLLYISPLSILEDTENILYKLDVKNIYLVDIGNRLSSNVKDKINEIADIEERFVKEEKIYEKIRDLTDRNDIVFSTIDPWTYWYFAELKPAGEKNGALFIGPAAYIAAHHGVPVLIVENHPELSSSVVWHNEFWRRYSYDRYTYHVNVADMVLTGRRIYDFLRQLDYDKEGLETIITVADQYDIGISWDRIFPGIANAGRICGTPVDMSCWISRITHYPAVIFANPAMKETIELINGSISRRDVGITRGKLLGIITKYDPFINLNFASFKLIKESGPEKYEYPVLCSFVTHEYRFNERASKYYGGEYECADGIVPGSSPTMEAIDNGAIEKYTGHPGSYFPDLTSTEVAPFYLQRGGYDVAYSTKLEYVVDNLNQGVLLWIHNSHGTEPDGGCTLFWNPEEGFKNYNLPSAILGRIWAKAKEEENPWRGYDWYLGCTEEPDSMSMDIEGILPFTSFDIPLFPPIGQAWVAARKPVREFINSIIPFIDPFVVDDKYDGVIGALTHNRYPFVNYNSIEIEENLENLHSAGFITGICETSNTYLQTMLIRHGTLFQIQDPWPTSWYSAVWLNTVPRDIALGYTVGEAYTRGIAHVGILYLGGAGVDGSEPQWWWDDAENVVFFGDPDSRIYVPGTEYSDNNNWERPKALTYEQGFSIDGHTPYGATSYPYARNPQTLLEKYILFIILLIIILLIIIALVIRRNKRKGKKRKKIK
jgi:hypothetical protein